MRVNFGSLERPDVDKIEGLSQLRLNKDYSKVHVPPLVPLLKLYFCAFLRSRSDAYSYNTGEKMVSYSDEQIKQLF